MSARVDPPVLAKQGDKHRADGKLATCEGCGNVIRWVRTIKGRAVPVAPYPLQGNWNRPLEGYGPERLDGKPPEKRGVLYVLPLAPRRAAASGWEGGAVVFTDPPSTVWGYRPHHADCPKAGQFKHRTRRRRAAQPTS